MVNTFVISKQNKLLLLHLHLSISCQKSGGWGYNDNLPNYEHNGIASIKTLTRGKETVPFYKEMLIIRKLSYTISI